MISDSLYQIIALDLPAILTALFSALACALLGNFLVLRRLGLMGDALSHSVLPGIVIAFLISGSRATFSVFIGAAIAAVLTAVLIEVLRRFGRLEEGAAMGVVFSLFFAVGVVLIEQAAARNVDLDADCLLHGQLETIFWYPPSTWSELLRVETLALFPNEVWTSAAVWILALLFVLLLFKELTIAAFDGELATAVGFNSSFLHYLLMIFVALAVVASFEAVGSILVIAMIICPAATARFYTDSLRSQISLSLLFAAGAVITGYVAAAFLPVWLGFGNSLNAAGMIAVMLGVTLGGSALIGRPYGVVAQRLRQRELAQQVLEEDILALLYRREEAAIPQLPVVDKVMSDAAALSLAEIHSAFFSREKLTKTIDRLLRHSAIRRLEHAGSEGASYVLNPSGRERAEKIIRSHRLWENYLVESVGLEPSHVHQSAEKLEHFTEAQIEKQLVESQSDSETDPHGKKIPQ